MGDGGGVVHWDANVDEQQIRTHLDAVVVFLRRHESLWRAHVVEFFRGRLWEILDVEWLLTLQDASFEELLLLPSYAFKVCWPDTLKEFLNNARSLALPRSVGGSKAELFPGGHRPSVSKVLAQGMNSKKLHEIGMLSSFIANISPIVSATEVIDVGAGQGYLAQVLAFQYGLPVVAIDCCAHNTNVTSKRAERIRKHYEIRNMQLHDETARSNFLGPRTVTCHIGSEKTHMSLESLLPSLDYGNIVSGKHSQNLKTGNAYSHDDEEPRSIVLAGLHACGDLSANMLRTFVQCRDVKALVSVGCCYNLLSEEVDGVGNKDQLYGFPLSKGVKNLGLHLGGTGRDLGCQSAERWKDIGHQGAASNFEVHAYRAALQIVLHRFYPDVAVTSPSVGRLGKARRRKQTRRVLELTSQSLDQEVDCASGSGQETEAGNINRTFVAFQDYTAAALKRLELPEIPTQELLEIWKEVEPFVKFIGPFWSLRSAIAPVLETLLLLDRLLYLKEQECHTGSFTSMLVPVFDPHISPRNMAIVATKK